MTYERSFSNTYTHVENIMTTSTGTIKISSERLDNESYMVWLEITTEHAIESPDRTIEITIKTDENGTESPLVITISNNGETALLNFVEQNLETIELGRIESDDPCTMVFLTILKDQPLH
jgi:hypothetical protein